MTMAPPERSRHQLHNFSLPPVLKWRNQRLLRCTKFPTLPDSLNLRLRSPPSSAAHTVGTNSRIQFTDDFNGIETVREKLTLDLRVDLENMKVSMMSGERVRTEEDDLALATAMARPWNLRTRRAACKAPTANGNDARARTSCGRLRSIGAGNNGVEKKKFSVSISKEEVEDDFLAMLGMKPPRRPKKRARVVQRQLDLMFPGLWLTEVTPESYNVPDIPES